MQPPTVPTLARNAPKRELCRRGLCLALAGALTLLAAGGCGSAASWSRTPAYDSGSEAAYDLPPRETAPRRAPAPALAADPARAGTRAPDARLADLASQVDALRERLQQLEGRVEELTHQVCQRPADPATEQLRPRVADLERQLQALQQHVAQSEAARPARTAAPEETSFAETTPPGAVPPPAAPAPAKKADAAKPAPRSATDLYQEALGNYKKKSYAAAGEQFARYLQEHPQGAKAAEARYYLADSHFQTKRLDEAIVEFNKVVETHPKSVLAPSALLKQAYAFKTQGKTKVYTLVLEKLVADYPNSPEAAQASKLLGTGAKTAVKKKGR